LGYFSLTELTETKVRGLGIERDRHFSPTPLKDIKSKDVQDWVAMMTRDDIP
jgi:hypothetical protein